MHNALAIKGGQKTITKSFERFNTYNHEEELAAKSVIETGILSKYLGCWHEDFFGGPKVLAFEKAWSEYFNVKHSIAVNSATSGLIAAIGAIGICPGDEVIVSPWTMSASATAILIYGGIPVFADIDAKTFNLDCQSVESNLSPRTKAIMVPNIFGQSADLNRLKKIAESYQLAIIEDAAQCPGAKYHNEFAGTVGDIGVFSLNYHKHIHTGEGGMITTNDDKLADRLRLIRNHAEAVVRDNPQKDLINLVGFNFRMGEIEAAIGAVQLKKLDSVVNQIIRYADILTEGLSQLPGIQTPVISDGCTHVYYVYPLVFDVEQLGISREHIVAALTAEGVPGLAQGYELIHLLPLYQQRIAFGKDHYPWHPAIYDGDVSYNKGICPVAEALHENTFVGLLTTMYAFNEQDVHDIVAAFRKVWANLALL